MWKLRGNDLINTSTISIIWIGFQKKPLFAFGGGFDVFLFRRFVQPPHNSKSSNNHNSDQYYQRFP